MRAAIHGNGRQAWRLVTLLTVFGLFLAVTATAQDKKDDKKDEKKDEAKPGAAAQPPAGQPAGMAAVKEPFQQKTADGVKLVGDFYPPPKTVGQKAPTLILLHAVGQGKGQASRKDWGKLPEKLQEKGYAVLAFDFRGYGDSKNIDAATLAKYALNQQTAQAYRWFKPGTTTYGRTPATLDELALLVNDLTAAKCWLNLKNNANECNSTNVCVIGAEQGASIGLLWLANEFADPQRNKNVSINPLNGMVQVTGKQEGEDVSCVIWLSMNGSLGTPFRQFQHKWMQAMRDKVATYAIYGEQDTASKDFWNDAMEWIKPKKSAAQYPATGVKSLPKSKLQGTKLLGGMALGTEDLMLEYMDKFLPKRPWQKQKEAQDPTYASPAQLDTILKGQPPASL